MGLVAGIGQAAGTQAVAQTERHVISVHDLANLIEVRVQHVLFAWAIIHCARSEPPRLTIPVTRFFVSGTYSHKHAAMERHVIDALLRLLLDHVEHHLCGQVLDFFDFLDRSGRSGPCRSGR